MTLTSAPDNIPDTTQKHELPQEAQNRANIVAQSAIALLEKNPNNQSAVKDLFGNMISNNLRDPENVVSIQDGLYEARDQRLSQASPTERLPILTSFSNFMTQFTQGIAQMNRDVALSNEANALKNGSDAKIAQVQSTYAQIIANTHPTQTA